MKRAKITGIIFLVVGFVLIFNSSLMTMTGNAVLTDGEKTIGSACGLIFIIAGLALFLSQKAGGLELEIIRTKEFEKDTRRIPKKEIENALSKIGTGLGKEEYIKAGNYTGYWSIRSSKGARIYYKLDGNQAKVIAYESSSEHR